MPQVAVQPALTLFVAPLVPLRLLALLATIARTGSLLVLARRRAGRGGFMRGIHGLLSMAFGEGVAIDKGATIISKMPGKN